MQYSALHGGWRAGVVDSSLGESLGLAVIDLAGQREAD
jgi:hypothetical protein